jgi:hypothetical protein
LVRRPLKAARRVGWALADQGLSSLTNLPLGLLAAHTLSARDFGAVNLVFTTYTVLLGISRATTSEPFTVRFSGSSSSHFRAGAEAAAGLNIILGIGTGLFVAMIGMLLSQPLRDGFLILGFLLPGLLFQDGWRHVAFARSNGFAAFLADLTWALLLFSFLTLLVVTDRLSLTSLVTVWGGSGAIAGIVACWNARVTPRPTRALWWIRTQHELLNRYAVEFIFHSGLGQAMWFAVAAVAGYSSLGSVRAAFLILSPIYILSQGLALYFLPSLVHACRRPEGHLLPSSFAISMVEMCAAGAWGLAVWSLPAAAGRLLLGHAWQDARPVILVLTLAIMGRLIASGPTISLRALAAARRGLQVGVLTSALTFAGGVAGALVGGAYGVAVGLLVASWLSSPLCWSNLLGALNDRARSDDTPNAAMAVATVYESPHREGRDGLG